MTDTIWTEELFADVKRLWLEGKSATKIAATLGQGLTKCAVIGQIHRAGVLRSAEVIDEVKYQQTRAAIASRVARPPCAGSKPGSKMRDLPEEDLPTAKVLWLREAGECTWPVGGARMCCAPVARGSYCAAHAARAYTRAAVEVA